MSKKRRLIKNNFGGIYKVNWKYNKKSFESTTIIFHSSDDTIIGLEICTANVKKCGGVYFLNGKIEKGTKSVAGKWYGSDNLQWGEFSIDLGDNKTENGNWYNHLHPKKLVTGRYSYTFNFLRSL